MANVLQTTLRLQNIAENIANFEDVPSKAGRPTGSASGGYSFESLIADGISQILQTFSELPGICAHEVRLAASRRLVRKME